MDNSNSFKFKLLGGLFVAIIAFAVIMFSQIETGDDIQMPMSSFKDEIGSLVEERIPEPGKRTDFKPRFDYVRVMDEIETERLLGKIDNILSDSCKELAFNKYKNYVLAVSQTILRSGAWNVMLMNDLDVNNKILARTRFCDAATEQMSAKNQSVVKDYKEALAIVSGYSSYANIEQTNNLINKAKSYEKKASLKVCKPLIESLSHVQDLLFDAHCKQVKKIVGNSIRIGTQSQLNNADMVIDKFMTNHSVYGKTEKEVASKFSVEKDVISQKREDLMKKTVVVKNIDENDY